MTNKTIADFSNTGRLCAGTASWAAATWPWHPLTSSTLTSRGAGPEPCPTLGKQVKRRMRLARAKSDATLGSKRVFAEIEKTLCVFRERLFISARGWSRFVRFCRHAFAQAAVCKKKKMKSSHHFCRRLDFFYLMRWVQSQRIGFFVFFSPK